MCIDRSTMLTATQIVIVLTVACLSQVKAEFIIEVEVHSYHNPSSTLTNGNCCDRSNRRPPTCTSECDTNFVFCFREFGRSDEDTSEGNCPYGRRVSGVHEDQDDIVFTIGENFPSGLSNPVTGSGASYPGSIQLALNVNDNDDSTSDDTIDLFLIDINIPVGTKFSLTPETHFGVFRIEHIVRLNFQLSCAENFFGPECATFCMERDDDLGHYTCGSDGSLVCRQGFQDPATNCVECIPADGCSLIGGFCNEPGECICLEGYDGENCLIDLDPCGHTFPCRNGSTCTNIRSNDIGYVCICPEGFSGRDCEQNEDLLAQDSEPDLSSDVPASILAGGIVGGIVGGLLLLGIILTSVVLVKGVAARRHWKTYTLNGVNGSGKTAAPTLAPLPGDNVTYVGVIGYHVPVEKTLTPANNTNMGTAEEHEFDNPLYADSASLSLDLEGQRSTQEPVYAAPERHVHDCEIADNVDQRLSSNESPSENQTAGEYQYAESPVIHM